MSSAPQLDLEPGKLLAIGRVQERFLLAIGRRWVVETRCPFCGRPCSSEYYVMRPPTRTVGRCSMCRMLFRVATRRSRR